ncbi:hypothetical protein AVEN_227214-1 [Araneus ventricosus]|uniref:Uncharacterized protein n=1 Tax=Araneus ventricosus TaxID=182803 RepID=A0A4Y2SY05_ARAVE|nr:hypothetical protein AVEN_227214-1 [Araneus ventricosus]
MKLPPLCPGHPRVTTEERSSRQLSETKVGVLIAIAGQSQFPTEWVLPVIGVEVTKTHIHKNCELVYFSGGFSSSYSLCPPWKLMFVKIETSNRFFT